MGLQMGALSVRIASLRLLWRPGLACPRRAHALARAAAEKSESTKESANKSSALSLRKTITNEHFEFAVGFENFCRSRLERRAARAPSPPRLAAGAGDRNAETLKDFYVLGLLDAISSRLFFGSEPSAFRIFQNAS